MDIDDDQYQNFDEVVNLTEYTDFGRKGLSPSELAAIPEYQAIDTIKIGKDQQLEAKAFVQKITNFIIQFDDDCLTEEHREYLRSVARLQISDMADMLTLVTINRQMLNNIIERINSSQLEDYAIINTYNMMVNQHLKLIKELQTHYKNIPNVIKKMKTDVLTDQILEKPDELQQTPMMTEDFGTSQFNNHKELLKSLLKEKSDDGVDNVDI